MDGELGAEIGESLAPCSGSSNGSRRRRSSTASTTRVTPSLRSSAAPVALTPRIGRRWCFACISVGLPTAGFRRSCSKQARGGGGPEVGDVQRAGERLRHAEGERGRPPVVRLSPFDQAHRRHTSFAQVIVSPLLGDDADVEIDEADIRVDTYRASGAGSQHVNKTDSAVRIPTCPRASSSSARTSARSCRTGRRRSAFSGVGSRCSSRSGAKTSSRRERGVVQDTGVRESNPQPCAPSVPAGQGPPDELRKWKRPGCARRRPRRLHPRLSARQRGRTCRVSSGFG